MSRTPLYIMFAEMGFKKGAEIGVYRGVNAWNMFRHIPDLELIMVDPWRGGQRRWYRRVVRIFRRVGDRARIIRKTSLDVAPLIGNGDLDFVYIDALHTYHDFMLDLLLWLPKVRVGGIISGHDYHSRQRRNIGVRFAVDDYVRYHKIDLKLEGRNWYWIIK